MFNREGRDGALHTVLLGPAVRTADATSAAFNTSNHQVNELEVDMGINGVTFSDTDKITLELTKSADDTEAGSYAAYTGDVRLTDVASGDTTTVTAVAGVVKTFNAAHAAAKRYIVTILEAGWYKATFNYSGTHSPGTPNAINLRQSHGRIAPA